MREVRIAKAHNAALEAREIEVWKARPERYFGYFSFPAEQLPLFGKPRPYRANFEPLLHTYINQSTPDAPGVANVATVTAWTGVVLGHITHARVYRHNFGARFVSLTMQGTNGAKYYGRASYDWGQCINLRKCK